MNEPCRHERALAVEKAKREDVAGWISRAVEAEAIVEHVRAIVADPHAALVVDRVRAALPTMGRSRETTS